MTERREVTFKAGYWYHEEIDDKTVIHVGGRTADNKTVHALIHQFTPFVYVELPRRIPWNKARMQAFFDYLERSMKSDGPCKWSAHAKYRLHYKKQIYTMFLSFPNESATKKLMRKCSNVRGFAVPGLGSFQGGEFKVHESNIDAVLKFTAAKNIKLSNWMQIKETIPEDEIDLTPEERKYTTADIDMHVDWQDVEPVEPPKGIHLSPSYCSFDIECYSKNHNSKLPNAEIPENVVFQISMVFGFLGGEVDKRHRVLLSLGHPRKKHIGNCDELLVFKTESELLLAFVEQIQKHNPDIFIGYNIMKFDWNYMIKRAEILGIYLQFAQLGRVLGKRADLRTINWSSSAYGEQKFSYLECHGRTNVDVLLEVERNFRLPKYTLDLVAEFFLKKHKEDVSPRGLFMLYQLTSEILPQVIGYKLNIRDLLRYRQRVAEIFSLRKCHGIVKEYRAQLLKANTRTFPDLCRKAMEITGEYCVQDTILPIDLAEKLNLWTTMEEMSNVTNVPASYLHTRGQQIKVLAQVYRETIRRNIIIPYLKKTDNDEKYQGAIVIEANEGDYEQVATLDFASLYPTVMISFNICYTTILEDNDPTPDEECNVLDWSDHVACIMIDTPVSLANRSEKIQLLNQDVQSVYAHGGEDGVRLYKQTAHYEQGMKECVALTFEDGTVLKCTPDHRILTGGGEWVGAQDLNIGGDACMTYRPPVYNIPDEYSFDFAGKKYKGQSVVKLMQLFGLLCSDGSIARDTLVYVGHKQDVASVVNDITELSGEVPTRKKNNYGWTVRVGGAFGKAFRQTPGIILATKATGRSLPDFLFDPKCPTDVIAAFLSGLFGGDGHTLTYSNNAHAFSPISFSWTETDGVALEPVFDRISTLLRRLNFNPTISKHNNEIKLRLPIEETLKFHSTINFAHCVHKAMRLEAGCLYLRHRDSVWQQQRRIVECVRIGRDELREKKKRVSLETLINRAIAKESFFYNDYYGHPSKSQMTDLLRDRKDWSKPMFKKERFPGPMEYMEKIGARDMFADGNGKTKYAVHADSDVLPVFNVALLHRESCGCLPTYDLEVDDSHSFVANGVVVHNCEHDPQKRKRKKEDVMCAHHRYRFRKVKYVFDETTGRIERVNEGLMPRLERNLLAERKVFKKEMFKVEARLKMHRGQATEDNLAYYKKMGWEIINPGSLGKNEEMMTEVAFNVFNAKQLAVKISANSVAPNTPIPCLVGNSLEYRTIEELFDNNNYTIDDNGNEVCAPPPKVKVWCGVGWSDIKYVFRHTISDSAVLQSVSTHTGCVDITTDHSLLTEDGEKITIGDVAIGDSLMHYSVPLPADTPSAPEYLCLNDEDIDACSFETIDEEIAFMHGMLTAGYIYNSRAGEGRVPKYILTSKYKTRLAFFVGYYIGDQNRCDMIIRHKGQIGASELYYLLRSLGYEVEISRNQNDLFCLQLLTHFENIHAKAVKSINMTPVQQHNKFGLSQDELVINKNYVYDIETITHHFAAGVGDLIVHNSAYGAMGVKNGMLPLIAGAASVTAMGRRLITMAIDRIKKEYTFAKLVYGDSVGGGTPILYRLNGKHVAYAPIEELFEKAIADDDDLDGKEYASIPDLEVWSDKGFTKVKRIMRHSTTKKLFRVLTHTGFVIVTEDHSLLNESGEKVTPGDVNVGDILLHHDLPDLKGKERLLCPYAMGLFYGDGSCGIYDCPSGRKHSWAINNTNVKYLERAERELTSAYAEKGLAFKILDVMESSHVYKLVATGKVSTLVKEWRDMFYSERKYKKIPDIIFSSNKSSRERFFEGYYAADGDKDKNGYLRMDNKGEIGAAGLYLLASSLGYPVSINTRSDKPDIYRLTLTRNGKKQRINPAKIKKIEVISDEITSDEITSNDGSYVYDLETENHHFAAGVGRMIVHNTDSCMIHFEGKTLEESFNLAEEASRVATHYLKCYITGVEENHVVGSDKVPIAKMTSSDPRFKNLSYAEKCQVLGYESCPIDLEFENMYGRFLLLTKKRYVAYSVNRKSEVVGVTKKGVVLTRRDNSKYLRDTYGGMTNGILDKKLEQEVMYGLYDRIQMLFTRQIPETSLIIYVGIKSVINYAKSHKEKKGRAVISQTPIDINGDIIDDPIGPLDPRLVYPNYPQVLLALKMLRRGEEIPPNTRLEFIYTRNPEAKHQGEKAEDYTYYKENKDIENMQPDYLHYLKKQLLKPVTELLSVKYSKGIIPYVSMEDRFRKCMSELNDLHRFRVANMTVYRKPRPDPKNHDRGDQYTVGWEAFRLEGYEPDSNSDVLARDKNFEVYTHKKYVAQATYIIDQMKYETGVNSISRKIYPEFYELCLWIKSVDVIDSYYKDFGLTRRKWKKPTYVGDKLRKKVEIVMMNDSLAKKGAPKGTIGRILDCEECGTKGNLRYKYDILFDERTSLIIKDVPREAFTTFIMKDGAVMKDIFQYRQSYAKVVEQIDAVGGLISFEN